MIGASSGTGRDVVDWLPVAVGNATSKMRCGFNHLFGSKAPQPSICFLCNRNLFPFPVFLPHYYPAPTNALPTLYQSIYHTNGILFSWAVCITIIQWIPCLTSHRLPLLLAPLQSRARPDQQVIQMLPRGLYLCPSMPAIAIANVKQTGYSRNSCRS